MAGLFTKQAAVYAAARPVYTKELFSKLAALTAHHRLAWDVGTGNGQAAIGVAEHYDVVVATDVSAEQLQHAAAHLKVRYVHTRRRAWGGPRYGGRGRALRPPGVLRRRLPRP
uniref:Methyltransferase domain-containing protein n=1 Tax=Arundo donax TaxID=35708 RepID=A0A0A9CHI1_ARUDO